MFCLHIYLSYVLLTYLSYVLLKYTPLYVVLTYIPLYVFHPQRNRRNKMFYANIERKQLLYGGLPCIKPMKGVKYMYLVM